MTTLDASSVGDPPGVSPEDDPALDRPRRQPQLDRAALRDAAVSILAATAVAVMARVVLDWHGILSTLVWGYVVFAMAFYLLGRDGLSQERSLNRIMTLLIWTGTALVVAVLGWMLIYLVGRGLPTMGFNFFTQDLSKVGPLDRGGGAKNAIIGTAEQVGAATVIVVPLAILTAVYLNEICGRLAGIIRFIVDALSGLPSIVAGLLIFTIWVVNRGFSGAAGSAALVVLMLPTVTRTSEEILRTIPDSLREASLALGAPQWRVVLRVVLPTAVSGLLTGVILGVARAVGETAPMLLTTSGSNFTNYNLFSGPQADLPTFIFSLYKEPNKIQIDRAWTAALILVILVLILFLTARLTLARAQRKLRRSR